MTQTLQLAQMDAADLVQSAFRNKLINGDMKIDQRLSGAAITLASSGYTIDMWKLNMTQASKLTAQQNAGSVAPPNGFQSYFGITTAAAYAVTASDQFTLAHPIEANNIAGWAWGTAKAQGVSLQFQIYSSLTGTFSGAITNMAGTRSYPFTFIVPTANTWTTINISNIPGDIGGAWVLSGAAGGLQLQLNLGAGANFQGVAGAWSTGNFTSVAGSVNIVGTAGATLYVTGVQLENGGACSPYELLPIGLELVLCQRHFEPNVRALFCGNTSASTSYAALATFKVPKRIAPTPGSLTVSAVGNSASWSAASSIFVDTSNLMVSSTAGAAVSGGGYYVTTSVDAGI